MKNLHGYREEIDLKVLDAIYGATYFESDFGFLQEHDGFRPGQYHLFAGVTGTGKSTLCKSILMDLVKNMDSDQKVLILLTEVRRDEFLWDLKKTGYYDILKSRGLKENVFVLSTVDDQDIKGPLGWLDLCEEFIVSEGVNLFIYDNITTSDESDEAFREQVKHIKKMHRIARDRDIPVIVYAHSEKGKTGASGEMLSIQNVRGPGTLANMAPYAYNLVQVTIGTRIETFVVNEKSRNHRIRNKYYIFNYDRRRSIYANDMPSSFEEFNALYKLRDKLGGK